MLAFNSVGEGIRIEGEFGSILETGKGGGAKGRVEGRRWVNLAANRKLATTRMSVENFSFRDAKQTDFPHSISFLQLSVSLSRYSSEQPRIQM